MGAEGRAWRYPLQGRLRRVWRGLLGDRSQGATSQVLLAQLRSGSEAAAGAGMMASSAERQRRLRARRRSGAMRITIDVSPAARAVLSDARWIGEWDEDDRAAVTAALQRLVDGIKVDLPDA